MSVVTITLQGIDNASNVISGATDALGGLGSLVGGALSAGLGVASAGFGVMSDFMGDAFSAALENEQAQSALAQVIKATGGAAGVTADEANAMASQFADLAGGSDDAIIAIETIGLRAGTVAEEDFPNFIQTALDLGTVMGSTEAAATLLARAGDDIGASIGKAEKAGILFTDEQKAQMIAMQDAGDTAGAVDLFMQQLANTTGGAAAANAETLTGKWELMKGKFGEAAESIGMGLLPIATQLFDNVIAPAIPVVTSLAEQFGYFFGALTSGDTSGAFEILYEAFDILSNAFPGLSEQINIAQAAFANLPATFASVQVAIQPVIDAAINVANAFIASGPMIMTSVQGMVDFVINLFNTFSPTIITNVTSTLNSLAVFWTDHGAQIMAVVTFAFNTIATVIGTTLTLVTGLVSAGMALMNGDTTAAMTTMQTTINSAMEGILSLVGTDLATFNSTWSTNWSMANTIVGTAWNNIKLAIANAGLSIIGTINTLVFNIASAFDVDWAGLGRAVISGIGSGIASAVGGLVQSAVDAALAAFNAAKAALGISSPSRLFATIGESTMDGMALGISSRAPAVIGAVEDMTTEVYKSAAGVVPMIGPSLGLGPSTSAVPIGSAIARPAGISVPRTTGGGQTAGTGGGGGGRVVNLTINFKGSARSFQDEIKKAVVDALKGAGLVVNQASRMRAG